MITRLVVVVASRMEKGTIKGISMVMVSVDRLSLPKSVERWLTLPSQEKSLLPSTSQRVSLLVSSKVDADNRGWSNCLLTHPDRRYRIDSWSAV